MMTTETATHTRTLVSSSEKDGENKWKVVLVPVIKCALRECVRTAMPKMAASKKMDPNWFVLSDTDCS